MHVIHLYDISSIYRRIFFDTHSLYGVLVSGLRSKGQPMHIPITVRSCREHAPHALIEVLASPASAADVPGCCDVDTGGTTGLIFRFRNAGRLAEACRRMITLLCAACSAMGALGCAQMIAQYNRWNIVSLTLAAREHIGLSTLRVARR